MEKLPKEIEIIGRVKRDTKTDEINVKKAKRTGLSHTLFKNLIRLVAFEENMHPSIAKNES